MSLGVLAYDHLPATVQAVDKVVFSVVKKPCVEKAGGALNPVAHDAPPSESSEAGGLLPLLSAFLDKKHGVRSPIHAPIWLK